MPFLQAIVTNDVSRLAVGQGAYAAYLTPQGRMLTDFELYRRPAAVVASVAPGLAAALAARLDQLVFSEDVHVADESATTAEVLVIGGRSAELVAEAFDLDVATLSGLAELSQVDWQDGFVARAGESLLPSFRVIAPAIRRPEIVSRFDAAGLGAMSPALVEGLRIEAGRPEFGADMTAETIPLEAGLLERAISTTKGCYIGQEVIVRILHRGGGRIAKRLAILRIDPADAAPRRGTRLECVGREVGYLTSVASSPSDGGTIALGYVLRDLAREGQRFDLVGGSGTATVTGFAR